MDFILQLPNNKYKNSLLSIGNKIMKTTIEISDALILEAKNLSREEKMTLRSLIEEGLREVISKRKKKKKFILRKVTFQGQGLNVEFQNNTWEKIRLEIYRGRGE